MKDFLIAAFWLVLGTHSIAAQTPKETAKSDSGDTQTPEIIVAVQPASPLLVTTSTRWSTPGREILDLYIVVQNRQAKPVRSYTTRIEFEVSSGRKDFCLIENIYFPGKVIKQDLKDGKSRFLGFEQNRPPAAIQVSIDYLEFTDGSTWGGDTCQTAEYLAGERAGGGAAIKWFQNLMKEKGMAAVVEAIRGGPLNLEKPSSSSVRWDEAFERGAEIAAGRIMTTYQNEGESEVAVVLSKPYDVSGSRN